HYDGCVFHLDSSLKALKTRVRSNLPHHAQVDTTLKVEFQHLQKLPTKTLTPKGLSNITRSPLSR
ncbi:MAG: hypothetical protein M3Q07_28120, partial [Pseudobdellovibrionaceae bacterium]|nr:hypothetical protein [Pseudobdellovibrionaceae bacterium]